MERKSIVAIGDVCHCAYVNRTRHVYTMIKYFTHQNPAWKLGNRAAAKYLLLATLLFTALFLLYVGLPVGLDWRNNSRPAAFAVPIGLDWFQSILPAVQVFLAGGNPYAIAEGYYRAPFPFWTFLALAPFALLPYWVGRVLLFISSILAFSLTARKMGADLIQLTLFLTSSAVVGCLNNGNIDWLVTLGLWMPPQVGLFFVLIKPQIGIGIALYWLRNAWGQGGIRQVVKTFLPISLGYLASFILYGSWLQLGTYGTNPDNMSAFPWVMPIGGFLLGYGLMNRKKDLSIFSGALLAPYVSQFSYAASLLPLFHRKRLFLLAWVLLWIPVIVRVLTP